MNDVALAPSPNTQSNSVFHDAGPQKSWYIRNNPDGPDLDIAAVWDDYTGSGIRVAVHDEMVNFDHPDLVGTYNSDIDYDVTNRTDDLQYEFGTGYSHGTAVAGVIAAANNGTGTIGVAFGAELTSLSFEYDSATAVDDVLLGMSRASDYDIVNNSWSFTKSFSDRRYSDSLLEPVEEGRDGLGTIMVFSAGNTRSSNSSNYLGFQNSPLSIAVGAVEENGDAASFSSVGANILVSAAGYKVRTTTKDDNYDKENGTSFAAPVVSGVAALMLEANADLGYRDVQQILAYSARVSELGDPGHTANEWVVNGANNFNGGGLHYSDVFGYGFVNAHAAVRLAETWTKQQTLANRESHTVDTRFDTPMELIAGTNDTITVEFTVDEAITAEHVQLSLDLNWQHSGNLEVYLTSPEGTRSQLMYDLFTPNGVGSLKNFPFATVAAMGENAQGTWTIEIVNPFPDATAGGQPMTGVFRGFEATVHGAAASADDTYIYTDEFAVLYDDDALAERLTLTDTDGGNDTINAASVTSDSTLDLNQGAGTVIAAQTLTIDGVVENAIGGDGDDRLIGNAADNQLSGWRGDDTFVLSGGADTLDGGLGYDTLVFDTTIAAIEAFEVVGEALSFTFSGIQSVLVTHIESFVFDDVSYLYDALIEALWNDGSSDGDDDPVAEIPPDDNPEDSNNETPPDDDDGNVDMGDWIGERPENAVDGTAGSEMIRDVRGEDVWLYGNDGDDTLVGRDGDDTLLGGAGDDQLRGDTGNDVIQGGGGSNRLVGGSGDDTLIAGEGDDILVGGDGADTFIFGPDSVGTSNRIKDFSAADGDIIDLTGLAGAYAGIEIMTQTQGNGNVHLLGVVDGETFELAEFLDDFDASAVGQLLESDTILV